MYLEFARECDLGFGRMDIYVYVALREGQKHENDGILLRGHISLIRFINCVAHAFIFKGAPVDEIMLEPGGGFGNVRRRHVNFGFERPVFAEFDGFFDFDKAFGYRAREDRSDDLADAGAAPGGEDLAPRRIKAELDLGMGERVTRHELYNQSVLVIFGFEEFFSDGRVVKQVFDDDLGSARRGCVLNAFDLAALYFDRYGRKRTIDRRYYLAARYRGY